MDKILFSHSFMGSIVPEANANKVASSSFREKTPTRANELVTEAPLGNVRSLIKHPTVRA